MSLTTSPPMRSLPTNRSGGRGLAKNALPPPSTTGWMYKRYSSTRLRSPRLAANYGPDTSISPSSRSLSREIAALTPSSTRVAFGPTDVNVHDTIHLGWRRHAAAYPVHHSP